MPVYRCAVCRLRREHGILRRNYYMCIACGHTRTHTNVNAPRSRGNTGSMPPPVSGEPPVQRDRDSLDPD